MKLSKIIGLSSLTILVIALLMFIYRCIGGSYNSKLLNELQGDILYLKRDDDLIIKIYKSNANLENEHLIYVHHDSIDNHNIINLAYNPETNIITFTAFDDAISQWSLFELNEQGEVTLIRTTSFKELLLEDINEGISNSSNLGIVSENGDLYLHDQITNEKTKLKNFNGIYNEKFSPGYIPLAISLDGKYVYYRYSKHATSIGLLLETLVNPNYKFETYVMNVETKQISRYVDVEQIIFLD